MPLNQFRRGLGFGLKSASRSVTASELDSGARCDMARQSDGTGFAERPGIIIIVNIAVGIAAAYVEVPESASGLDAAVGQPALKFLRWRHP